MSRRVNRGERYLARLSASFSSYRESQVARRSRTVWRKARGKDLGGKRRKLGCDRRDRSVRTASMGVDGRQHCDRPSIHLVGRRIIIYICYRAARLHAKVALTIATYCRARIMTARPPLTNHDRAVPRPIAGSAHYANPTYRRSTPLFHAAFTTLSLSSLFSLSIRP